MISMSFDDVIEPETPPHRKNGKQDMSLEELFGDN